MVDKSIIPFCIPFLPAAHTPLSDIFNLQRLLVLNEVLAVKGVSKLCIHLKDCWPFTEGPVISWRSGVTRMDEDTGTSTRGIKAETGYLWQCQEAGGILSRRRRWSFINNTLELVTILCTPTRLNCLTLDICWEGIITTRNDVSQCGSARKMPRRRKVKRTDFGLCHRILTRLREVESALMKVQWLSDQLDLNVEPDRILKLMKQMMSGAGLYNLSGVSNTCHRR